MKNLIKFLAIVMCVAMVFSVGVSAASNGEMENTTYDTYTYWNGYTNKKLIPTRPMFEVSGVWSANSIGVDAFESIKDIFISDSSDVYLLDSTKLVVLDVNGSLKHTFTEFKDSDGNSYDFVNAKSVYVDAENTIYIADGINEQVLIADKDGNVFKKIFMPESSLIPEDLLFCPAKVTTGLNGDIYVLSEGCFYGALLFDKKYNFKGFFGANTVVSSVGDFFTNLWDNFFTTDEQRAGKIQKIPYQFTDICTDSKGFIWTSTGVITRWKAQQGQIKCLSPSGVNILKVNSVEKNMSSTEFDFSDFGLSSDGTLFRVQDFVGIDIDENGFIYAVDKTYGKVFVYDSDCNALNIFGGGVANGSQKGTFTSASGIAVDDNKLFVIDYSLNTVTVFDRTEYGNLVLKADSLTLSGDHSNAVDCWKQVLSEDRNSQVAYRGIAKALIIEGKYDEALEYARLGNDKENYSTAFFYVRNQWIADNFVWLLLALIAVIASVIIVTMYLKRHDKKLIKSINIRNMLSASFKPFVFANNLKSNHQYSIAFGIVILILYYVTHVSKTLFGGFLHTSFDADTFNSFLLLLGSVGVVLLWVLCNWAMCVAVSGKSNIKETFAVACCAIIPQLVFNVLYIALSNALSLDEAGILTLLMVISYILSFIILCIGTMIINEFDFFKFIGTGIATLIAMAIVIFMCFMLFILFQQVVSFVTTIFNEVCYR